jgi:hypothetical protein
VAELYNDFYKQTNIGRITKKLRYMVWCFDFQRTIPKVNIDVVFHERIMVKCKCGYIKMIELEI